MEIRNTSTTMNMGTGLIRALELVRKNRNFDADMVLEEKVQVLNQYFEHHGLKSAVVAVSGGIDSAVVLGLVAKASCIPGSPIERIVAVTLPAPKSQGVTGQITSRDLAIEVCKSFGVECKVMPMDVISKAIRNVVENEIGEPLDEKKDWARGQVVSYARTPVLYYVTSVLAGQGQPGVVVGTINLSEGGYLGYFGKAGDGLVDIQLISDLYKSEVYALGERLMVPKAVMERVPTGDMFDACSDEIVFGAPYDFIELWMEYKRASHSLVRLIEEIVAFDPDSKAQWDEYQANLQRMHQYNAHKYLGKSPSVHLDVMDVKIAGGWDYNVWKRPA